MVDEETNPLASLLRLSGIARPVNGCLVERNRIYERVFDPAWVRANMPDAELRRQRAAFQRGVVRAAAVFLFVGAILTLLLFQVRKQRDEIRNRLVEFHVATGVKLMDQPDLTGSLPYFAEALRLVQGRQDVEKLHRLRLGAILSECPKLIRILPHERAVQ